MGINIEDWRLEEVARFLNCKVGSVPFKYLGVPVGANAKRVGTWMPLINHLRGKLNKWENQNLSFGGKLTLINAVLANMPVYLLSVYKAPKRILKMVEKIQRDFLWGCKEGSRKIAWVAWKQVCQDREYGDLGVKNVRLMNLTLLGKWRWRLLNEEGALWHQLLAAKYRQINQRDWRIDNWDDSPWWKEIWSLQSQGGDGRPWLEGRFQRMVNNGTSTLFWKDVWRGNQKLESRWRRLFRLSAQKEETIANMVVGSQEEGWRWDWKWRRPLFDREKQRLMEMEAELPNPSFLQVQEDAWVWTGNSNGNYTVNKAYKILNAEQGVSKQRLMEVIWSSPIPKKVSFFMWRALKNRLPSMCNLHKRGVITSEDLTKCIFCGEQVEDVKHVLWSCRIVNSIWKRCLKWWNIALPLPNRIEDWMEEIMSMMGNQQLNDSWFCMVCATVWVIWNERNARIFKADEAQEDEIISKIQWFSWEWLVTKRNYHMLHLSDWKEDPIKAIEVRLDMAV